MLEKLRQRNKDITIRTLDDPQFEKYGRVLEGDFREPCHYLEDHVEIPKEGNAYIPDDASFRAYLNNQFSNLFGGAPLNTVTSQGKTL